MKHLLLFEGWAKGTNGSLAMYTPDPLPKFPKEFLDDELIKTIVWGLERYIRGQYDKMNRPGGGSVQDPRQQLTDKLWDAYLEYGVPQLDHADQEKAKKLIAEDPRIKQAALAFQNQFTQDLTLSFEGPIANTGNWINFKKKFSE